MAILAFASLAALLAPLTVVQKPSIHIERSSFGTQTGPSSVVYRTIPFAMEAHIRGSSSNMANRFPALYPLGSGGVPQCGPSSSNNSTPNFSAAPSNATDFMFKHYV